MATATLFPPDPVTPAGRALAPVTFMIERHHAFKKRPPHPVTGKRQTGCEVCRRAKMDPLHLGAPPSMNAGGSGHNRHNFQSLKSAWQSLILDHLRQTDLPKGLSWVLVEGRCCFPDRAKRDQGNFRWMFEKAFGDALEEGGYLPDGDDWDHYEFGNLQRVYEKGRSFIEVMVFPRL